MVTLDGDELVAHLEVDDGRRLELGVARLSDRVDLHIPVGDDDVDEGALGGSETATESDGDTVSEEGAGGIERDDDRYDRYDDDDASFVPELDDERGEE